MDNDSSFPSDRKNKSNFSSNCHSKTKFKSNYINNIDSTQPEKQTQVPILDSQHIHQVLECVAEPRINHLNSNSNVTSCKKKCRKKYYSKIEDDISKVSHTNIGERYSPSTYPLEEIQKYKSKKMEDCIQTTEEIIHEQQGHPLGVVFDRIFQKRGFVQKSTIFYRNIEKISQNESGLTPKTPSPVYTHDEQVTCSKSLKVQQVKGDSYVGKEHIRQQKNANKEKNIDRHPARYIPSPDPLAIATSQVFSQDYEAMPLESPSNIYEARIYNYSKVKSSPSKKKEKHMFVSQEEKPQAIPARSSSHDSHNSLTFSNRIVVSEKYARYSELKKSHCNFDINYPNDDEPQALNLEVPKVCKVGSSKMEHSSLQSKDNDVESPMSISSIKKVNEHEIRNNTGTCSLDEKSKNYESGKLLRKIPLCDEKDLPLCDVIDLNTNEARVENEDPNAKFNLRRSSRVPTLKKYPEKVFGNDVDDSSPGIQVEHVMKNSNGNTGELWECNNCDAMFRSHDSLMRHHNSCHLFTCYKCNWQGSAKTDYELHMSTEHFKQIDRCLACREEFSSYDLYKEHMIHFHKTIIGSYWESNATVEEPQQTSLKSRDYISIQNKERDFDKHAENCSNEPLAQDLVDNNPPVRNFFDMLPDTSKILKDREKQCDGIDQTSHENSPSASKERTSPGNKKCPYCPKSFMRHNKLVRHLNYHLGKKNFVCSVCKKSFVEKSGLVAHMVTHNPVNVACKHCNKVFKTQRTLKRHLQTHENRTYACDLCNKVFHHMESLRVHKLTHNEGGSGNTCNICNKDCKTPYYLQVHLKTKHGSAKFECKDCRKFFKWKQSFTKHRQVFHKDPDNDPKTENVAKDLTSMFECEICSRSYCCMPDLLKHQVSHRKEAKQLQYNYSTPQEEEENVAKDLTSKFKFLCEICSRPYSRMSDLLKHQVSHTKEGKHTCDLCGKNFKYIYTRNKHIKMVHDDSNKQECPQCKAKFKVKEYLDQHIAQVHTTKDRVKCRHCGNDFKTEANLKSHIKIVHGHKKSKYICKNCKRSFTSPKDLARHQKTHTGVRDFQCPVCQRGFSRKDNLTAHLRTHTEPATRPPAISVSSASHEISSECHISSIKNETKPGPHAISVSSVSDAISSAAHISSSKNETSPIDTGSSKNVHEPITLTLPGNDITISSSQNSPDILSQSRIDHISSIKNEKKTGAHAISVSSASYAISSASHISSIKNETNAVDTGSSKNVHEPITLTLPGNDITISSSQNSPDILSEARIESPSVTTKQYNCSFPSSITATSAMPHQMITTVSPGLPVGKDKHTSTATCILTVPNASLSSSPIHNTVPTSTSVTASFIALSNGSSITSPSSILTSSSSSASPLITLASSSLSSLTSTTVLPATHLSKESNSSMEVEVMPDLPQAVSHSELQQDHLVIEDGILPLITPDQTHFSEPHVVYTIIEGGSSKLETLETLSIHPLSPNSTSGETELVATKHDPLGS